MHGARAQRSWTARAWSRFFGNHDVDWRDPKLVKKHLDAMLPGIEVLEALKLRVLDGQTPLGLLFLVHGHQGTDLSDRASWLSRAVLRTVWRKIQNWQGWLSTTPAADYDLRAKHDIAMFRWSRGQALAAPADQRAAMIAGHTHHPVFPDHPPPQPGAAGAAELEAEIAQARARGAGADELGAALRRARTAQRPRAAQALHATRDQASDVLQHGLLLLPRPRRHGPGDRRRQGHPGALARRRRGGAAQGARASHPARGPLRPPGGRVAYGSRVTSTLVWPFASVTSAVPRAPS